MNLLPFLHRHKTNIQYSCVLILLSHNTTVYAYIYKTITKFSNCISLKNNLIRNLTTIFSRKVYNNYSIQLFVKTTFNKVQVEHAS